jgi:hypothetical protein
MLLMVRADTTVIRAAIYRLRMRLPGIFAGFIIIPYLFVIFDIDGDQDLLKTMFLTDLGKIYIPILKNDLGAQLPVTLDTKADSMIVIDIVPLIFHFLLMLKS